MRFLRDGYRLDAPGARAVEIQPGDLAELQPVRRYLPTEHVSDQLAAGGTVRHAYRPSAWEWAKAHRWLCLGLVLIPGPVVLIIIEAIRRWKRADPPSPRIGTSIRPWPLIDARAHGKRYSAGAEPTTAQAQAKQGQQGY